MLPTFKKFRFWEITTGRLDQFLKRQARVSYAHAWHSRLILNLMFNYALRRDALHHNPVRGTTGPKQPLTRPVALDLDELHQVRQAVASWRTGPSVSGPPPDGQVKDVIEVKLGTSERIGEALALRKRDIDDTVRPMQVTVSGTLVVIKGQSVYRQDHPKTSSSNRTLQVPNFTADVLRRRLALIEGAHEDHLVFFTRVGTPLSPYDVRRTLQKMLADAGLSDLKVTPHTFRRTAGTVIARATDAETAAEVLGNSPEIAKKHYIEPEASTPIATPAVHLHTLAPRRALPTRPSE